MNIFILERKEDGSIDWVKSAQVQDNYRVVKMPLECAQMVCTNLNELAGTQVTPYRSVHKNHPCTIWARKFPLHLLYLMRHGLALCSEFSQRFGKEHKCRDVLLNAFEFYALYGHRYWHPMENGKSEEPPLCMPDEFKSDDIVESYRKFYSQKPRMRYPKDKVPDWFLHYRGDLPYEVVK